MLAKISDLKERQAINIHDGKCLGPIRDIEIDMGTGRIKGIVLPGTGKLFSLFTNRDELFIPWESVIRIGIDVVLVELAIQEIDGRKERPKRGYSWKNELEDYKEEIGHIQR